MNRLIALGIMEGEIEVKSSVKVLPNLSSNIKDILENQGVKEAYRALNNYHDKKLVMLILADVAESVVHIYENQYFNDTRVRDCINGVRDYCNDKITKEELELLRNASNAASASNASNASSAASYAASAASNAASNASNAYASYAASAASYAAYASNAAAREEQWKKNEEILRKYL